MKTTTDRFDCPRCHKNKKSNVTASVMNVQDVVGCAAIIEIKVNCPQCGHLIGWKSIGVNLDNLE